ncbi:uncharacterized protein LACBIDRAFT_328498 [Laccaria bicolor S238N-H82]|uniref:Predicted protein n=1 Tax=Laccaria bicolor (strain S238N-H82 / ATCC MYA-4686) TaxID=486041 RepID=B0DF12_LACBS|nr:uncharacterized protein LACBIDRAFT_328498 [Laccaria bicolor S238N-H82]EDR06639.1 predicted protein [Laccaria bicolor S238N-H82]|eukprot:XP_001882486.1 predicted protein [Laccaria bicolor S238N-H82]
MPYRKISKDIKIAAMHLYEDDVLSKPAILDYLTISSRTFDRILALWNATGDVVRETNGVRGRPRILHFSDIEYLKRLIQHRPDWFLDELQYLLQTNRFISAHFTTVHRELVRAGISAKKIKKAASECDEDLQADFIGRMGQYSPEQLGFLDEVSKDERTSSRAHGMIASTVVEGSMTRDLFIEYLEFTVVFCSSIIYTLDAALCAISWKSECVSDGQCKDSPWGGDSRAGRALWD